jgi:uncharacterized protein (TIGR02145 family)
MKKDLCFIGILAAVMLSWGCSDPCEDVSCANGGVCVDGNCSCAEGWTGDDCTEPIETVATGCGDVSAITFDGHSYDLVQIGSQCWFAENLRSDNYRNGDAIPGNLSNSSWQNTTSGAQAVYNNDAANVGTYGRLYNWYATQDSRGLCPTGFHVPSDGEWMTLETSLGMTQSEANEWAWRGTDQGTQMKSSPTDTPSWDGSNTSGFSGLPAGLRSYDGGFNLLGDGGDWWSSSPDWGSAFYRGLDSGSSDVLRNDRDPHYGFSVRCVRD